MLNFLTLTVLSTVTHTTMAQDPNYNCKVVSRQDWGAQPRKNINVPLATPTPFIVIHHSAIPEACYNFKECVGAMQAMQNFHMDVRKWDDIGYNFGVGSDGLVYEGRGWGVLGAHALYFNNVSIGICLIGNWNESLPPRRQIKAALALINCGVAIGQLGKDYKLIGHRQVRDTDCPGNELYQEIKKWPHYVKFPNGPQDLPYVPEWNRKIKGGDGNGID